MTKYCYKPGCSGNPAAMDAQCPECGAPKSEAPTSDAGNHIWPNAPPPPSNALGRPGSSDSRNRNAGGGGVPSSDDLRKAYEARMKQAAAEAHQRAGHDLIAEVVAGFETWVEQASGLSLQHISGMGEQHLKHLIEEYTNFALDRFDPNVKILIAGRIATLVRAAGVVPPGAPGAPASSPALEALAKHQLPKFEQLLTLDETCNYMDLSRDFLNHHSDTRITNAAHVLEVLAAYYVEEDKAPPAHVSKAMKLLMRMASDPRTDLRQAHARDVAARTIGGAGAALFKTPLHQSGGGGGGRPRGGGDQTGGGNPFRGKGGHRGGRGGQQPFGGGRGGNADTKGKGTAQGADPVS